jgi:hypothetical protein
MNTITLYHGSHREVETPEEGRCMYFTPDIDVAKEYALGLDDCGNYNEESWIYSIQIDLDSVTKEDDFLYFDGIGYNDYNEMPEIAYNVEFDYYCVKNVHTLTLIENYKNEL